MRILILTISLLLSFQATSQERGAGAPTTVPCDLCTWFYINQSNGDVYGWNENTTSWDLIGSGGGSFSSFDWGDGSSTTTISDGETIQVLGGSNGIDASLSGNNVTVTLDLFEAILTAPIDGNSHFIFYDALWTTNHRVTSANLGEWIEDELGGGVLQDGYGLNFTYTDGSDALTYEADTTELATQHDISSLSSLWTESGANIYYSAGKVAIGTSSFAGALNISGQVGADFGSANFILDGNFSSATGGASNFGAGSGNFDAAVSLSSNFGAGTNNFVNFNGSAGNSVGIGSENFEAATTGFGSSVGMGYKNFELIGAATGSVGIGTQNFAKATSGTYNVGIGYQNADSGTSGNVSYMTAINYYNLRNITAGNSSVAIGRENFEATTNSEYSVGLGRENFEAATTTILGNVGLGYQNYHSHSSTSYANVGIGYQTMEDATSGSYNTAIGYQAGQTSTDLSPNYAVAIGYQALYGATSLDDAIAIGREAGKNATTSNSIHLGDGAAASRNNEVSLGSSRYNYGRWDFTGQVRAATGTTAQRQSATEGDFRMNSDSSHMEVYTGSAWKGLAYTDGSNATFGGGGGGGTMDSFFWQGDGSSTEISDGETISVTGNTGLDAVRVGNGIDIQIDGSEFTDVSTVSTTDEIVLYNPGGGGSIARIEDQDFVTWIEGEISLSGMTSWTWGGDASTVAITNSDQARVNGADGLKATLSSNTVTVDYDFTGMGLLSNGDITAQDLLIAYDASDVVDRYKRVTTLNFCVPGIESSAPIVLNGVSAEPTGSEGGLFFDTDDDRVKMYNSTAGAWQIIPIQDDISPKYSGFTEYTTTTSISPEAGAVIFTDALEGTANMTLTINPVNLEVGDRIIVTINGDATYDTTLATSGAQVFYSADVDATLSSILFSADASNFQYVLIWDGTDFFMFENSL